VDFATAFAANHDYTPAFMVGALESVVRSTIARTGDASQGMVTTADLVNAANGFRAQYALQQMAANRVDPLPTLDQAFMENQRRTLLEGDINIDTNIDYDYIEERVNNVVERRLDGAQITDSDGDPWTEGDKAYIRTN
jgi:hypothetical protein